MGLILVSLLFFAVGIFIFLTSVNYAWILWEKERVDTLTKQIRPNQEGDIFKRSQVREYTQSFDIRSAGRTGVNKAQKAYEKTMVAISDGDYPSWFSKAIEIFENVRKDFFASCKRFVSYLLHLAKADEDYSSQQTTEEQREDSEVEQTIARVKESAAESDIDKEYREYAQRQDSEGMQSESEAIQRDEENEIHSNDSSPIRVTLNTQKQDKTATISLSNSGNKASNAAFEKLEARILDKLKQSGLNHYAIWLELGELYIKYEEQDKASEVFALVLKNTKNDKEKEIARNRLIGL
jgi:hypothetical protein